MRDIIRQKAFSFLDQRELENNSGFEDPIFEQLMKLTGWLKGQAWCVYFAELVWMQSNVDTSLFSGSAVQTWGNFDVSDKSKVPEVGDVVIWQTYRNGKPRWTGHAGIVVGVDNTRLITVEGNTNKDGSREGIEVALKSRTINWNTNNGLRLKGFIKPTTLFNS